MEKTINSKNNLLYANAFYLIADVAFVSISGFAFWTISAKLYTPAQFGLASATIAMIIFLARLSLVGFDYGIIRFFSSAEREATALINSCFTITGLLAFLTSSIFLGGLTFWADSFLYLHHPLMGSLFILFCISYVFFLMIERVFIAQRCAKYVLLKNIITGVLKIVLVVSLTSLVNASYIVLSWGSAAVIAMLIAIFWALPRKLPGYSFRFIINTKLIRPLINYSLGNHFAGLLWFAPFWLFPVIVINTLGAEVNAYFYIPWVIAQTIFGLPLAISYSLFAEGSTELSPLKSNIRKSLKLCLFILFPVSILLIVFSDQLLLLFGTNYSTNGFLLLRLLAISVIPVSINNIGLSVMRVRKKTGFIFLLSVFSAFLSLSLGYLLMIQTGINGIGSAWLAVQTILALFVLVYLFHYHSHKSDSMNN